jgi:hypothetical protein
VVDVTAIDLGRDLGARPTKKYRKNVRLPALFQREIEPLESVTRWRGSRLRCRSSANLVVALALLWIGKNLESLVDPLIANSSDVISGIDVRVEPPRQLPKCSPDLDLRGFAPHSQQRVIVVPVHPELFFLLRVDDLGVDDVVV